MVQPNAPYPPQQSAHPHVESWRVITQALDGHEPVSDATLRVRIGGRRLIVTGEGHSPSMALELGIADALESLSGSPGCILEPTRQALLAQCGLDDAVSTTDPLSRLRVDAMDGNAMLHRVTTLLGPHDVEEFVYHAHADGRARITLDVRETGARVGRLAAKLRRVIGVLNVSVEAASTM